MNLFFAVLSFGACAATGFTYSSRYRKIYLFWNSFLRFNRFANVQIKTFSCPIEKITETLPNGDFKTFAKHAAKSDANIFIPNYLTLEEKEYLTSYFHQIRRIDFAGISSFLEGALPFLEEREAKAKSLYDKNTKFSKKLGILSGLALFILMV